MAVQWRTETSTGNLTECYQLRVRSAVEEQRLALGFGRNQVFFNTDLVGQASTTYNASVSVFLQLCMLQFPRPPPSRERFAFLSESVAARCLGESCRFELDFSRVFFYSYDTVTAAAP